MQTERQRQNGCPNQASYQAGTKWPIKKKTHGGKEKKKRKKRGTTNNNKKHFLKRKRRQEMSARFGSKAGYT